jgi:hypothetical protein
MPKRPSDHSQGDLFYEPVYPSRVATDGLDMSGFRSKLKRAMSQALKECPYSRHEVAMRMAEALGQDTFSKATLDAYTAESKESHDISLVRFKAFVRATAQHWLWDLVVSDEGMTMLMGDEARLAEAALLRQQKKELDERLKRLEAQPVHVHRRRIG